MLGNFIIAVLAAVLSVQAAPTVAEPAPVPLISNAAAIAAGLKMEPSSNDRFKKLLTDGSGNLLTGDALRQLMVFDFNNQKPSTGAKGGSILLATVDTSPILEELGISGAVSLVEPCGLNIPHLHPRANEMFTVIEGILHTGMVQENGFNTEIETQLGKYQATVFPMAESYLEDPGRSDIATSYWMLPSDVVDAALGYPETIGSGNIEAWRPHLPVNLASGVDSCLKACGLSK
ncbi:RmlC-like cupin domain-containing protein [Mycena olivaceomarginata]|nr:RmlC-like cupin domain-containing protein [Mycena olivaceomarginata]